MTRRGLPMGGLNALLASGRAVLVSGALLCSSLAIAQAVPALTPDVAATFRTSVSGAQTTFTNTTIKGAANAASFAFAPAANGSIYAQSKGLYFNGTQHIPVQVSGSISATQASGAIGRALSKMFFPLQAGIAVYDLAKELGYNLDNSSGSLNVGRDVAAVPGKEWSFATVTGWHSSAVAAAQAYAGYYGYTYDRCDGDQCFWYLPGGAPYTTTAAIRGSGTGTPATTTPSSVNDFVNAIAAKSGWPSNSPVARALNDALRIGEGVELVPGQVTGPAESPGPQGVTDDGTNIVEKDTKHKYTYNGPSVSNNPETTTTTKDKATGNVTNVRTETASPEAIKAPASEGDFETCGLPGKPACLIDETLMRTGDGDKEVQQAAVDQIDAQRTTGLEAILSPDGKDTSWSVGVPSWLQKPSCTPLDFGSLPVINVPLVFNMCPYEGMIDGITSFILLIITFTTVTAMVRQTIGGS